MNIKSGIGYDVHQLARGNKLIVGGIDIPSKKGSVGHSDGDALLHAITDAVLGAVALGDIGLYFPSEDDKWKNADSKLFLEDACEKIKQLGLKINNVDSIVILQRPKLRTYIDQIRKNVADILKTDIQNISVKATTTDYLGFIGTEKGWAVQAVVTLVPDE